MTSELQFLQFFLGDPTGWDLLIIYPFVKKNNDGLSTGQWEVSSWSEIFPVFVSMDWIKGKFTDVSPIFNGKIYGFL